MRRIFYTSLLFAVLIVPSTMFSQSWCFPATNDVWDFEQALNDGADCALAASGAGCEGIITHEENQSMHVAWGIIIDECDLWCADNDPGTYSSSYTAGVFNTALAIANANAPICPDTGLPKVVIGFDFFMDICVCGDGSQLFLAADLVYACCEVGDDCEASFEVFQSSEDCNIYLTNTSTPSSINDCGDCDNPSGITSVSWSVYEYHAGPIGYVSYLTGSNDFHYVFDPSTATGPNDGFQICMTIEDCVGCSDRHCVLIDRFVFCRGLQDDTQSLIKLSPNEKSYFIYPNPVNDLLNIQINSDAVDDTENVLELYSLQGQLMLTQHRVGARSTLDVSTLSKGIYYLAIKDSKGVVQHSEKVIIQ